MEEEKKEKKSKKGLIVLIPILAAALLAGGLVLILGGKKSANEGSSEDAPSADDPSEVVSEYQYFWNVDRDKYAGKSDIGMSSRTPDKDDGYYHVLFATNGRQVVRRVAEKKVVNLIDGNDLMGLVFDEKGIVVGMKPLSEISDGYEVQGFYVESVDEDRTIHFRSSATLKGETLDYKLPENVHIYDVSGNINYVGQEINIKDLIEKDRMYILRNLDGTVDTAFVTQRYIRPDIYWNVERQYNSEILATKRTPNANGEYEILMALHGEQVVVKTKTRDVASAIDANAAKCWALQFDEEGYVKGCSYPEYAFHGHSFASWYNITSIENGHIAAIKTSKSASDYGKTAEGDMSPECEVYDVSGTGAFVGVAVDDLRVGDRIHGITDADGVVQIIYIVNRNANSPVYWNVERKYDSEKKSTTRTPNANGLYEFTVAENGNIHHYFADKEMADSIDAMATRCFGLYVDGERITKLIAAEKCINTGGGTQASWYTVVSMTDPMHFHCKKLGTGSDAGRETDVVLTKDTVIVNGTTIVNAYTGELTNVRLYDRVHCLKDWKDEVAVVFVVGRYENIPVFWNVSRKYDSTKKETTRVPDADGYYVFNMLSEGKEVVVRTKNKAFADKIDSAPERIVGLKLNGDIITGVEWSTSTSTTSGGSLASWYDISGVTGNTYHALKTASGSDKGQTREIPVTSKTKIWNVSGTYENHPGEITNIRIGDRVHCLKDPLGNVSYVFIVKRNMPDKTAYCPVCKKTVTWKGYADGFTYDAAAPSHYYIYADRTPNGNMSTNGNGEIHWDMNGKTVLAAQNERAYAAGDNAVTVIMDLSAEKTGRFVANGGALPTGSNLKNGSLMFFGNANSKVTLMDVTIDGSSVNRDVPSGIIFIGAGNDITFKNCKIIGGNVKSGSAIFSNGNLTLEDCEIVGGTSLEGGAVTINKGSLTLNGKVTISGGKQADGSAANLYMNTGIVAKSATGLDTDSKMGVRLQSSGIFADASIGEKCSGCFTSDMEGSPVTKRTDNQLEINYVLSGIQFASDKLELQVGEVTDVNPKTLPIPMDDVKIILESSDPTLLQILPSGQVVATGPITTPVTLMATTEDGKYSATTEVTASGSTEGKHYHVEGTAKAIHDKTGTEIVFTAWESDTALPTASGYYYLTKDVHLKEKQPLQPENTDIHLCLNGYSVIQDVTDNVQAYCTFYEGATFSLMDCSEGEKGVMTAVGTSNKAPGRVIWVRYGTFNFYGGTLVGADCTHTNGGGAVCISNNATMNMYGGIIRDGSATQGGNLYVQGELNVFGGQILNGKSTNKGGNIYGGSTAKMNLKDTTVTGGTAVSGGNLATWGSSTHIENTEITNGTASDTAGNLQILAGTFDLIGSTVSGGKAGSAAKSNLHFNEQPGYAKINVLLKDSSITGGILLQQATNVTLSGKLNIVTDDTYGIYYGNKSFTAHIEAKDLDKDSRIQITAEKECILVYGGADYIDNFEQTPAGTMKITDEDDDLIIGNSHRHCICGGLEEVGDHTECKNVTWAGVKSDTDLRNIATLGNGNTDSFEKYVFLENDITLTKPLYTYGPLDWYICLNGYTLTGASGKQIFSFEEKGVHITVTDCSEKEEGKIQCQGALTTARGQVAFLYAAESEFTLFRGTLTGGQTGSSGANIYCDTKSVINIYGGTIEGGKAATYGGNVYLGGSAVLNMYGGKITGGQAGTHGGNIRMEGTATFNMKGGEISEGTASKYGGNIAISGDAVLNMDDGEIKNGHLVASGSNNPQGGGNIYGYSGSKKAVFNMNGGTISGGTGAQHGGNVEIENFTFNMKGGTIKDATTTKYGGNVCLLGTMTMSGGTIENGTVNSGNKNATYGGNVLVGGAFTMSGGTVKNGVAKENSGNNQGFGSQLAVMDCMGYTSGKFTMTGGTISGGEGLYGSIYLNGSHSLEMTGGTISGGYAYAGGAIYSTGTSTVTIGGTAALKNNQCASSGFAPAIYANGGTLTLKGTPTFSGNNQYKSGKLSDIYVKSDSKLTAATDFAPVNPVSVTRNTGSAETETAGSFGSATTDKSACFAAMDGNFTVTYSGGKLYITAK